MSSYINKINAFYDQLEINPLSSSAVALWHALLHINNKSGWIEEFTVAASVLCIKSGLKDSMFKKARNELKTKNYIQFHSRNGNQSAKYIILWSQYDHSSDYNGVHNSIHSSDHNGVPLIRQEKNRQEKKRNKKRKRIVRSEIVPDWLNSQSNHSQVSDDTVKITKKQLEEELSMFKKAKEEENICN